MLRHFHAARLASGELQPQWAAACPASASTLEGDAELPNWRVQSKRTSAGRDYRVFFGPLGEHVRSRVSALQLASLCAAPEAALPPAAAPQAAARGAAARGAAPEAAAGLRSCGSFTNAAAFTNAEAAVIAGS